MGTRYQKPVLCPFFFPEVSYIEELVTGRVMDAIRILLIQPIASRVLYRKWGLICACSAFNEGEIIIRIFEDGGDIVFSVSDNGVGVSPGQSRNILKKQTSRKRNPWIW